MRHERDSKHKDAPLLDDDAGRGEVSKEGFKDYDQEFHPAEVEIEGDPDGDRQEDKPAEAGGPSVVAAASKLFEVHFRMMKIRNRAAAFEDYQAPQ